MSRCEFITPKKKTMTARFGVWIHTADGVTIISFWTHRGRQVSLRSRAPFTEHWWKKLRGLYGMHRPRKPRKGYSPK